MSETETSPIRAYRHAQNPRVSLAELAAKVGVSKGYLSRIETGNEELLAPLAEKLSDATGIPMRVLMPDLAKRFDAEAEAAQ